jgi:hypothetical protein
MAGIGRSVSILKMNPGIFIRIEHRVRSSDVEGGSLCGSVDVTRSFINKKSRSAFANRLPVLRCVPDDGLSGPTIESSGYFISIILRVSPKEAFASVVETAFMR